MPSKVFYQCISHHVGRLERTVDFVVIVVVVIVVVVIVVVVIVVVVIVVPTYGS